MNNNRQFKLTFYLANKSASEMKWKEILKFIVSVKKKIEI